MPDREIKSGSMVFRMFSLGGPEEFDIYESGKNEYENYAPFMFQFEDISSKKGEIELGGIYYENSPRVLPVTYQITKEALVFTGTDKQLGKVSFKGRMDLAALKKAQKSEAYDKVVVVGDLTFAGKTFKKVEFTWFAGD